VTRVERLSLPEHARHAVEARFGLQVSALLSSADLPHDIQQRLRVSRELAIAQAAPALRGVRQHGVVASGTSAVLGAWWVRLGSLLPLVVLALGLVVVQWIEREERIRAAADIDTVLLADELPPSAYADPGFTEYLRRAER
jgi:hypothetical protein